MGCLLPVAGVNHTFLIKNPRHVLRRLFEKNRFHGSCGHPCQNLAVFGGKTCSLVNEDKVSLHFWRGREFIAPGTDRLGFKSFKSSLAPWRDMRLALVCHALGRGSVLYLWFDSAGFCVGTRHGPALSSCTRMGKALRRRDYWDHCGKTSCSKECHD